MTSGSVSPGREHRLEAVRRLADDLDVGLGIEDHPEAGADERLVVDDQDPDGHAACPERQVTADDEAAAVTRSRLERAAAERDALPHPGQPVPGAVRRRVRAPVVRDLELELPCRASAA